MARFLDFVSESLMFLPLGLYMFAAFTCFPLFCRGTCFTCEEFRTLMVRGIVEAAVIPQSQRDKRVAIYAKHKKFINYVQ